MDSAGRLLTEDWVICDVADLLLKLTYFVLASDVFIALMLIVDGRERRRRSRRK